MVIVLSLFAITSILFSVKLNIYFSAVVIPVFLAFISFYIGFLRLNPGNRTNFILLFINCELALITINTKLYFINIYLISMSLWFFLKNFLKNFKIMLNISIAMLLLLSFIIPYYKLSIPLILFVYYPFYILGHILNSIKIKRSVLIYICSLTGIISSLTVLVWILSKCINLNEFSNMLYTPAFSSSVMFVYAPPIMLFFLIIMFSLFALLINNRDIFPTTASFEEDSFLYKMFTLLFLITTFIFSLVISSEYILRENSIKSTIEYLKSPAFAYNLIFVSLIYLFIMSAAGKKLGTVIMLILHTFIISSNYIKLRFFNEPFYLWDIFLIKNALIIYKDYVGKWTIVFLSAAIIILVIFVIKYLRHIAKVLKPVPNIKLMLLFLIPLIYNFHLLNNDKLYNISIFKDWNDGIEEFQRNGTYVQNYLYIKNINKYLNKKPADYSVAKINKLKSIIPPVKTSNNLKPNVIVVLSETYWAPSNLQGIQINKAVDKNMNKYRTGTLVSSDFGWSTANIEFELLTGLTNFYFSEGVIPYNVYLSHSIPSIVSAFRHNGYNTIAIHPNVGYMYNRSNVYKYLGFNTFKDLSFFNLDKDKKGNYVSDDRVVDMIIETLKEEKNPKFIFAATIQNHDPYDNNTKNYKKREIDVTSDKLESMELEILSNYSQGVYDADNSLDRLIDEVKKINRPTLIYYFGDHLPRLGAPLGIYDIYDKLGYIDKNKKPEEDIKFYETPLITWSNFKEMNKFPDPISPNQLAVEILMDSGISYPDYFNYLLKLRGKYPYLNNNIVNKNNLMKDELIDNYYLLEYDIMFGNQYLTKASTRP